MPTLNNPYSFDSPFADSLSTLAKAFASGPDEATKRVHAETALKLARQRQGNEALAGNMRSLGTPMWDQNSALANAFLADKSPELVGVGQRVYNANTYGAADPRTDNSVVGAGGSYGNTAEAFKQTQAGLDRRNTATIGEQRYQFDNKPTTIGTPTGPQIARQSESYGKPAVEDLGKVKGDYARRAINQPGGLDAMSDSGKIFVGADKDKQPQPHNYIAPDGSRFQTTDGTTDARTGRPLPPGGLIAGVMGTPEQSGLRPTVQAELQKQDIEQQKLKGLIDYTRKLATDPANFGVSGFVKGLAQDTAQVADNVAKGLGYKGLQDAVVAAQQKAVESGVDPKSLPGLFNFDPRLPSLHTAADLLVYQAASALAGQSGRSVSDRDVKMFREITGDPRDWLGNQDKYLAKLDTIEQLLGNNQAILNKNLRGGQPSAAAAPAAPGAPVPQPPAPGAPQIQNDPLGIR